MDAFVKLFWNGVCLQIYVETLMQFCQYPRLSRNANIINFILNRLFNMFIRFVFHCI